MNSTAYRLVFVVILKLLDVGFASAGEPAGPREERAGAKGLVTVRPEETDDVLANPGVGWQTFHHTGKQDRNLPAWIPSTMHYARWGWGELEPEEGKLNEAFLDKVLNQTRESGQKLAFRVMCCSTNLGHPYHPAWLKRIGGRILEDANYDNGGPFPIPDLDDPIVLEKHLDFIRRLGRRYDGHPDLDHVDLGTVGWWGEWHLSGSKYKLPTLANRIKIVDCYLAAFKKTPLLMLIGADECLKRAVGHGAGWRADCLGDMGGFSRSWNHMEKGYPVYVREAAIQDAWQTAPVAWESCWDMRKWVAEGWSLRFIFNYALALHGSQFNNKSAPLPAGENIRPEIERFLRRLGYRLVLKRLSHPATAKPGQELALAMEWQNIGSAPCYRPYRLAYRLSDGKGFSKVFASPLTVNRWLPGSIDLFTKDFFKTPADLPPGKIVKVADSISLPKDLPAGHLTLSIAVVGEETRQPVVRLGIRGREPDGWYPLSRLVVTESGAK